MKYFNAKLLSNILLVRIALFIIFFFLTNNLLSQKIAIYSDDGTWIDGILALESFLDDNNIQSDRVYANDLNSGFSFDDYTGICFPGGYAFNYKLALSASGLINIRNFIDNGGFYIGICAGAFFASATVDWEGDVFPYQLELFAGIATGSIESIAKWDDYAMTQIGLNHSNPICSGLSESYNALYYGGPYFTAKPGVTFDTVAVWKDYNELPAIINFEYGKGRVCLIGPHLEIEENSNRDNTEFASELDDIESDWQLLRRIFEWGLDGKSSVLNNPDYSNYLVYPNPANSYLQISPASSEIFLSSTVELLDILGESVLNVNNVEINSIVDISNIPSGNYFLRIESKDNTQRDFIQSIIIIK